MALSLSRQSSITLGASAGSAAFALLLTWHLRCQITFRTVSFLFWLGSFGAVSREPHDQALPCFGLLPGNRGVEKDHVQRFAALATFVLRPAIVFRVVAGMHPASAVKA